MIKATLDDNVYIRNKTHFKVLFYNIQCIRKIKSNRHAVNFNPSDKTTYESYHPKNLF